MARKPDLSGLKNFFFEKGEKIGLIACLAGMGVFVGYGVMNGLSAKQAPNANGATFPTALKNEANKIRQQIENAPEIPPSPKTPYAESWAAIKPTFPMGRYYYTSDKVNNKRLNPPALPILASAERKEIQMDYVRGSYFAYDIDQSTKTASVAKEKQIGGVGPAPKFPIPNVGGGKQVNTLKPFVVTQPTRMVVVNAVFPLRQQLNEFRRAFRMVSDADLFASKDLPKFLGLNVWKTEVVPGKPAEWRVLVQHNPKTEKLDVDPAVQSMLRQAIFDDQSLQLNFPFAVQGLVMPLPKLAILPKGSTYPKVELAGLELDPNADPAKFGPAGNVPGVGPGGQFPGAVGKGGEVEVEPKPWSALAPDLRDQFNDKFFVLDPLGIHFDPEVPVNAVGANPGFPAHFPNPVNVGGGGVQGVPFAGGSPFAATAFWTKFPAPPQAANVAGNVAVPVINPNLNNLNLKPYDAMVRFFDPSVKPGKTYKYMVQVRLANPNYKKIAEVAFAALAEAKELPPAPPVETPSITIPEEYYIYAVDQKPENKVPHGSDMAEAKPDQVAVQIHRWIDKSADSEAGHDYTVGDWAIAERILVRRGQPISRVVNVEIPVWNFKKGDFELSLALEGGMMGKGGMKLPPKGGKVPITPKKDQMELGATGIPINFGQAPPPSVLVDFDGGKKKVTLQGVSQAITDDSASNILVLQGDGKLVVLNSRTDSETDSEAGKDRLKRVNDWKAKTASVRVEMGPNNNVGPNPAFPGGPVFPGMKKN